MNKQKTITINNVEYDTHTGMRVTAAQDAPVDPAKTVTPAHSKHTAAQKSQTLTRKHVRSAQPKSLLTPARATDSNKISRSPHITRFAQDVVATKPKAAQPRQDIAAAKHPIQKETALAIEPTVPSSPSITHESTTQEIKQQAITKALENSTPHNDKTKSSAKERRMPRAFSIATASLAIVFVAGYLTYLNLPSLSVKIASSQAGIDASYPSYHPSGYSISGPVEFSSGDVSMKFNANAGPQSFSVEQVKSSWDSSALLENYVEEASAGDYTTYTDSGLTVYVYDTGAAWVSGGILHTIKGDAPLSNDQIRRIATSM